MLINLYFPVTRFYNLKLGLDLTENAKGISAGCYIPLPAKIRMKQVEISVSYFSRVTVEISCRPVKYQICLTQKGVKAPF